jgi:hypothetical protein
LYEINKALVFETIFSLTDVACVNAAKEEALKMSVSAFSGRRNGKTTYKKKG